MITKDTVDEKKTKEAQLILTEKEFKCFNDQIVALKEAIKYDRAAKVLDVLPFKNLIVNVSDVQIISPSVEYNNGVQTLTLSTTLDNDQCVIQSAPRIADTIASLKLTPMQNLESIIKN